jgi:hypothetical protein
MEVREVSVISQTVLKPFIHSIAVCRMLRFLAFLMCFFHSSLLYTLSFHPFPPTNLQFSLTSSCHLFLVLPLSLFLSKFMYNTFLWILFSSTFCTCPNQHNLFSLIVSVIVGFFLPFHKCLYWLTFSDFPLWYTEPKILLYNFLSKIFICFVCLSLLVSRFVMHTLMFF